MNEPPAPPPGNWKAPKPDSSDEVDEERLRFIQECIDNLREFIKKLRGRRIDAVGSNIRASGSKPIVSLRCRPAPDRGGAHPEQHLAGYVGLMQADAYAGFGRLYEANRKGGPIIEAACWAHGRRKFFDLARISKAPIASRRSSASMSCSPSSARLTVLLRRSVCVCARNVAAL